MTPLFLIGCDPEFMIKDASGELKSALKLFKGRKHEPEQLRDGASLADNVNFEFNTTPADSPISFKNYIKSVLQESARTLPAGHKFAAISGADFPKDQLKDKEACEFGCEPDYNAWLEGMPNQVPEGAASRTFRSAGGHVHIGFTDKSEHILSSFLDKIRFIQLMDAILGVTSVFLDNTEGTKVRRTLYGKAGCYRLKGYGVEYRTVSNFWAANPKAVDVVYKLTELAVKLRLEEKDMALVEAMGKDTIISTINESKDTEARVLYRTHIEPLLSADVTKMITSVAKDMNYDIHKNWKLATEE